MTEQQGFIIIGLLFIISSQIKIPQPVQWIWMYAASLAFFVAIIWGFLK
jgi:hypothetical protein